MYYPTFYMFRSPAMLLPHESTVSHEQVVRGGGMGGKGVGGFDCSKFSLSVSLSSRDLVDFVSKH